MQRMLVIGLISVVALIGAACGVLIVMQHYESAAWLAALGIILAIMPSMLTIKEPSDPTTSGTFARMRMSRPGTRLREMRALQRSRSSERIVNTNKK